MTQQATIEATPAAEQEELAQVVTPTARGGLGPSGSGVSPGSTVSPRASTGEDEALIADELLVEEVSIDGMCGVY
jgi:mycofactocin precursor